MNLDKYADNIDEFTILDETLLDNHELFLTCLKKDKVNIALKFTKFITKEILEVYKDKIIESLLKYFPSNLKDNKDLRDFLINNKEYNLLIEMNYNLLKNIEDKNVIAILDDIANKEIERNNITNDYTKYKVMEQGKYNLLYNNTIPEDKEFIDLYYDKLTPFLDRLDNLPTYLLDKAIELSDFDTLDLFKYGNYIDTNKVDEIVKNNFDKVVSFNKHGVSTIFAKSKELFNYYLENKNFERIIEFSPKLLTEDIINKYEEEILDALEVSNFEEMTSINKSLFNLCLKHEEFELCSNFDIELDNETIKKYGSKLIKYMEDIPFSLEDNELLFQIALENNRFDLVDNFDKSLITDEIVTKYGLEILNNLSHLPYTLQDNKNLLKVALDNNRYDLIRNFDKKAFTKEILYSDSFKKYITNIDYLPHFLINSNVLELALSCNRYDLIKDFVYTKDAITKEIINKYGIIITENLDYLPEDLRTNETLLINIINNNRLDLIDKFDIKNITIDTISKIIDALPTNSTIPTYLIKESTIDLILKKERYDLIRNDINYKNAFTNNILNKYTKELLTKVPFIKEFSSSNTLLKYALLFNIEDKIKEFNILAYDDELVNKYGNNMLYLLANKYNEYDYNIYLKNTINLPSLLNLFLENNIDINIEKFDYKCFTNNLIDKHYNLIIDLINKYNINNIKNNTYLLNKIIENKDYKSLNKMNINLLSKEVLLSNKNEIIKYSTNNIEEEFAFKNNSIILDEVLNTKNDTLLSKFEDKAFTKDLVDKHFEYILYYLNNTNEIPLCLENIHVFEKLVKENYINLASKMSNIKFNKEYIDNNYNMLYNLVKDNKETNLSNKLLSNIYFVEIYIKSCDIKDIEYISKYLFIYGLTSYYAKLIEWVNSYNNSIIPNELLQSESLKEFCKKNNYNKEYLQFPIKYSYSPKKINIDDVLKEYLPRLDITREELEDKLNYLYSKNNDIYITLLPELLNKRYEIFSKSSLINLTLYPELEEELSVLNDKELNIVNKILIETSKVEEDSTKIIYNVLNNIKYYKSIINEIDVINEEELYNLIYILQRKENIFNINSIKDLSNDSLLEKLQFNNIDTNLDINKLKDILLIKEYGISLEEARFISSRYANNIKIVKESDLNEYIKEMLIDLNSIIKCEDKEELRFKISKTDTLMPDFKSMLYLESYIRNDFARLYNDSLYKIDSKDKIDNKDIYYIKDDFNMFIHSLGAYTDYTTPDNFKDDWNRPKIASHGICTSYIANNEIATAVSYHPILGFDSIKGSEMLLQGTYDIGSNEYNKKFSTSSVTSCLFAPPKDNINNTRHNHNETVIERMVVKDDEIFKRMPSYVVYILDDINNKYNFTTKEDLISEFKNDNKEELINLINSNNDVSFVRDLIDTNKISIEDAKKIYNVYYYEEVSKCSKDMNLPIVIIDRLYHAKRENNKCFNMYEQFKNTLNPSIINELIINYSNNLVGTKDRKNLDSEYSKVFTNKGFEDLIDKLVIEINNINELDKKEYLLKELAISLEKEDKKRCSTGYELETIKPLIDKVNNSINNNIEEEVNYVKNL